MGCLVLTIIMYIYHALIDALRAHKIHIKLNRIFYTHVEHNLTNEIYMVEGDLLAGGLVGLSVGLLFSVINGGHRGGDGGGADRQTDRLTDDRNEAVRQRAREIERLEGKGTATI